VHRFATKNDYDASETGECDRNLRRCAKSFTRFQEKSRCSAKCGMMRQETLPLLELANVLMRFDHIARFIVSAETACDARPEKSHSEKVQGWTKLTR
jgi:hypothetical protein